MVDRESRPEDPPLSEEIDPRELAPEIREELRSLPRADGDLVARRLVAAGQLVDVEPGQALAHALVARRLASRIPAVREATGLAAYQAGQWQTAISELRAYHRMTGRQAHVAVLADCERALGRPERAIDLYRATDASELDDAERVELLIVAAGARMDLRQPEAAVAMLQVRELVGSKITPWLARLRYAFADALLAVGRKEEAREWFARAAEVDDEVSTDAAERLLELDGVVLEGDELEPDTAELDELERSEPDLDELAGSTPEAEELAGSAPDLDELERPKPDLDLDDLDQDDLDQDSPTGPRQAVTEAEPGDRIG